MNKNKFLAITAACILTLTNLALGTFDLDIDYTQFDESVEIKTIIYYREQNLWGNSTIRLTNKDPVTSDTITTDRASTEIDYISISIFFSEDKSKTIICEEYKMDEYRYIQALSILPTTAGVIFTPHEPENS